MQEPSTLQEDLLINEDCLGAVYASVSIGSRLSRILQSITANAGCDGGIMGSRS